MATTRPPRKRPRSRGPRRTRLSPGEIRSSLYGEALFAFRTRGFEEVTVSELTRVTGVAKGTFFNHFPTKDHVLSAYLEEVWASAEEEVAEEGLVGTDAIVRIVDAVGRALESDPPLAQALGPRLGSLLVSTAPDGSTDPHPLLDLFRDRFRQRLEESLPFTIPLQEIGDGDLATLLVGSLAEGIREGVGPGRDSGVTLVPALARGAVFLIRSAGFAAPDVPRS